MQHCYISCAAEWTSFLKAAGAQRRRAACERAAWTAWGITMRYLFHTGLVTLALAGAGPALAHETSRSGAPAVSAAHGSRPAAQGDAGQERAAHPEASHKHDEVETEFIF